MYFLCPHCRDELSLNAGGRLVCATCGDSGARQMDEGLIFFDRCQDTHNFFEKQALEQLDRFYQDYDDQRFEDCLGRQELWEMDEANRHVGITKKFWWERYLGKIENKRVLDVGSGVNYIVPYLLRSDNEVVAFDVCAESVRYQRKMLGRLSVPIDRLTSAVADVEQIELSQAFDVVNVNNVLHHVDDKLAALSRLHRCLNDDGKLMIVEPNYYYPPRWIIETDVFDPFNAVKNFFVRNYLIEQGEKAVIFSELTSLLAETGFRVDHRMKDENYLSYFTVYWMRERSLLARTFGWCDRVILGNVLPRILAPFEYIVASKV